MIDLFNLNALGPLSCSGWRGWQVENVEIGKHASLMTEWLISSCLDELLVYLSFS